MSESRQAPYEYATRAAHRVIEDRLRKVFATVPGLDLRALAAEIADGLDVASLAIISDRERGMQEALAATMRYFGDVHRDLRDRLVIVEGENQNLRLQLARRQLAAAPPGSLGTAAGGKSARAEATQAGACPDAPGPSVSSAGGGS